MVQPRRAGLARAAAIALTSQRHDHRIGRTQTYGRNFMMATDARLAGVILAAQAAKHYIGIGRQ